MQYNHHLLNEVKMKNGLEQKKYMNIYVQHNAKQASQRKEARPGNRRRKVVIIVRRREIRATATTLGEGNVWRTNSKLLYSAVPKQWELKELLIMTAMQFSFCLEKSINIVMSVF